MTRFDLIWLMLDRRNRDTDHRQGPWRPGAVWWGSSRHGQKLYQQFTSSLMYWWSIMEPTRTRRIISWWLMEVDGPLLCVESCTANTVSSCWQFQRQCLRSRHLHWVHDFWTFLKPQSYLYESSNHWNILKSQSFQLFYDPSFHVNCSNRHCQV